MNFDGEPETKPENEAIDETMNIPDEDRLEYNILKFEDEKIDKNKYKIKHAMKHTKARMGTSKYNNCTIHNRTICVFKSQIQYNCTIAMVQACTISKSSV